MWRPESRENAQTLYLGFVFLYSDNCPVVRPVEAENYLTNKQKSRCRTFCRRNTPLSST